MITLESVSTVTDLTFCPYIVFAQASSLGKDLLAHHLSVSSNPVLRLIIFHSTPLESS